MRMFAKFLVYSNLILSLIFLAWALALYTQRLDWAPHRNLLNGERDEKSGRLYNIVEEIKELVEHRDLAEKRWVFDATTLPREENRRLFYRAWYDDQVALAKTGRSSKGPVNPPIIQLERDKNDKLGLFLSDPKDRKSVQINGKDVKSIQDYQDEYSKLKGEIDKIQEEVIKLVEENEKLTQEIAGIPGKTAGLRKKVDNLVLQKKEYDDEIAILKPLLYTQKVNIEQQKRRMEELEKRVKDLQRLAGLPQLEPIRDK